MHRWLALGQGPGPEEIHGEADAWDTTGLPARFEMARHLLLRQDRAVLVVVRQFLAEGTIGAHQIVSWPIFDHAREAGLLDGDAEELEA